MGHIEVSSCFCVFLVQGLKKLVNLKEKRAFYLKAGVWDRCEQFPGMGGISQKPTL